MRARHSGGDTVRRRDGPTQLPGFSSGRSVARIVAGPGWMARLLLAPLRGAHRRRAWLGFSLVSQISRDEVAHLARLARLALTDAELDSFSGQLDAILTHVSQIQAVDVSGVEPTDNPLKDVNVTRPDEITPCLTQQEALAEAPEAVEGRFAVPRILGEPE